MFKVGDASPEVAFLTSEETGYDVALLHRIQPETIDDAGHKAALLSEPNWQRIINLVDAAPRMHDLLKRINAGESIAQEEIKDLLAEVEELYEVGK